MNYQKFDSDKTFIVMQKSGFGVMEAPYEDVGIVYETDSKEDAYAKSNELLHQNNSPETIESSWIPNTYWVVCNTNTEVGAELLKEYYKNIPESKPSDYKNTLSGHKEAKVSGEEISTQTWINPGYSLKEAGFVYPIGYDKELKGIQRKRRGSNGLD